MKCIDFIISWVEFTSIGLIEKACSASSDDLRFSGNGLDFTFRGRPIHTLNVTAMPIYEALNL